MAQRFVAPGGARGGWRSASGVRRDASWAPRRCARWLAMVAGRRRTASGAALRRPRRFARRLAIGVGRQAGRFVAPAVRAVARDRQSSPGRACAPMLAGPERPIRATRPRGSAFASHRSCLRRDVTITGSGQGRYRNSKRARPYRRRARPRAARALGIGIHRATLRYHPQPGRPPPRYRRSTRR